MFLAHAGHLHTEAATQSPNQMLTIIGAVLLAAIVIAVFIIADIRHKHAVETVKSVKK